VIGIKCAITKAWLLKEIYSQLSSLASYEKQIGIFLPISTVHLIGPQNYTNLLRDHNNYLRNVTTIHLGDFQHVTLNIPFSLNISINIDQMTLMDVIAEQEWCISMDKTNIIMNKVMIMTTKPYLAQLKIGLITNYWQSTTNTSPTKWM